MYEIGMMNPGMMQPGMIQQGMIQQGMIQQGMIQQGMMQPGMMQKDIMQQGMIQQGMMTGMMSGMMPNMMMPIYDPIKILETSPIAKVKQQIEFLELVTSCETKNRYDVYAKINEQNVFLFRCKEQSEWCMRNCCPGNCREFNLKLTLPNQQKFAILERPFKCTCCCCNRPMMTCKLSNGEQFGKVKEPYRLCSPFFEIYDENNNKKFGLEIPCCQCGFCCRDNCYGKCYEVFGNIYKINDLEHPIGIIKKKEKCLQETITDANTFLITFPVDANVYDKLNLISAVLMIDYRYYEENSCSENI